MNREEIQKMLWHAEQETVYSFISTYAESDPKFCKQLTAYLLPGRGYDLNKETYQAKAENCFDFESGGRGWHYNFYQAAYDAASGLDSMLSDADYFFEQGEYASAAEIAISVVEVIPRNYDSVDDSSGSLVCTFNMAIGYLVSILHNREVTKNLKTEIYEWVKQEMNNPVYSDYGFDGIEEVYEAADEELGETDEVLANLDRQIEEANEYNKERLVLRKIRFMQSRGIDSHAFIEKYLEISSVRKIRFDQLLESGLYNEALVLAQKGAEKDSSKTSWQLGNNWKESILEVYLRLDDKKNIILQAEKLLCESYYGHDKYYQIIKKYINHSEWEETLERILTSFEKSSLFNDFVAEVMVEHQMWKRLLDYCKKGKPVAIAIEKYESYLKPHFEKEILGIYHEYVEEQALITHNSAYYKVANMLKHMRTFNGGNDVVKHLLNEYRNRYKRRRNMMAALSNL
ncbi:hypothetical protein LJC06_01080 [Bacteroidales bacterium OttesenSCG-928-I14]|nr:hypothetical protein [Bacteroidales bacterium OttesenSCG-928-I14]